MDGNQDKETFNYTYSAKEQKEIEKIRKKYVSEGNKEDKMQQLRRLDRSVTDKAMAWSLTVGVLGALIMGVGMCLVMVPDFSEALGLPNVAAMAAGVAVGLVGLVIAGAAYPIYNVIVKKQREKIAPEIIRLTDELMK